MYTLQSLTHALVLASAAPTPSVGRQDTTEAACLSLFGPFRDCVKDFNFDKNMLNARLSPPPQNTLHESSVKNGEGGDCQGLVGSIV
jgi:hypothetical protein